VRPCRAARPAVGRGLAHAEPRARVVSSRHVYVAGHIDVYTYKSLCKPIQAYIVYVPTLVVSSRRGSLLCCRPLTAGHMPRLPARGKPGSLPRGAWGSQLDPDVHCSRGAEQVGCRVCRAWPQGRVQRPRQRHRARAHRRHCRQARRRTAQRDRSPAAAMWGAVAAARSPEVLADALARRPDRQAPPAQERCRLQTHT
jgi:hypothetical protein